MESIYRFSRKLALKYNLSLTPVYLVLRILASYLTCGLITLLYIWVFQESIQLVWFFPAFWALIWGYIGGIVFLLYRNDHTGD